MHTIERLWTRPRERNAMEEQASLELIEGKGVVGDHAFGRMRHVTLIFADDWAAACHELGVDVDPSARRANVLLSGGNGGELIGKTVRIGEAVVRVRAETAPCPVMDRAAQGLQDALKPDQRGGVWGRVEVGAVIRPGDTLEIVDPE